MSANNNRDHIPQVLDLQYTELSQPHIHGILRNQWFKSALSSFATSISMKHGLAQGSHRLWHYFSDMQVKIQVFRDVMLSMWFLKFFKIVLPSSSQSSSSILKATQPFTTSATTHPMTRLATQKTWLDLTWLDNAVRTPDLTMQIQTKFRQVSFHAGLPSWTMSCKSNTKFPLKIVYCLGVMGLTTYPM